MLFKLFTNFSCDIQVLTKSKAHETLQSPSVNDRNVIFWVFEYAKTGLNVNIEKSIHINNQAAL